MKAFCEFGHDPKSGGFYGNRNKGANRGGVIEGGSQFGEGGGFVFNTIHNVQATTPTENLLAMFRAVQDS